MAALSEADAGIVNEEIMAVFVTHTPLCSPCLTEILSISDSWIASEHMAVALDLWGSTFQCRRFMDYQKNSGVVL